MIRVAVLAGLAIGLTTPCATAGPVEDISAMINGRSGSASEDRRGTRTFLGVKVDCPGDTLEATVRIVSVAGVLSGEVANMTVTYAGEYTRQGWGGGCNRLPGAENGPVSGQLSFSVLGRAFTKPVVTWGAPSGLGSLSADASHDSNVFAIRAAQSAVASAF